MTIGIQEMGKSERFEFPKIAEATEGKALMAAEQLWQIPRNAESWVRQMANWKSRLSLDGGDVSLAVGYSQAVVDALPRVRQTRPLGDVTQTSLRGLVSSWMICDPELRMTADPELGLIGSGEAAVVDHLTHELLEQSLPASAWRNRLDMVYAMGMEATTTYGGTGKFMRILNGESGICPSSSREQPFGGLTWRAIWAGAYNPGIDDVDWLSKGSDLQRGYAQWGPNLRRQGIGETTAAGSALWIMAKDAIRQEKGLSYKAGPRFRNILYGAVLQPELRELKMKLLDALGLRQSGLGPAEIREIFSDPLPEEVYEIESIGRNQPIRRTALDARSFAVGTDPKSNKAWFSDNIPGVDGSVLREIDEAVFGRRGGVYEQIDYWLNPKPDREFHRQVVINKQRQFQQISGKPWLVAPFEGSQRLMCEGEFWSGDVLFEVEPGASDLRIENDARQATTRAFKSQAYGMWTRDVRRGVLRRGGALAGKAYDVPGRTEHDMPSVVFVNRADIFPATALARRLYAAMPAAYVEDPMALLDAQADLTRRFAMTTRQVRRDGYNLGNHPVLGNVFGNAILSRDEDGLLCEIEVKPAGTATTQSDHVLAVRVDTNSLATRILGRETLGLTKDVEWWVATVGLELLYDAEYSQRNIGVEGTLPPVDGSGLVEHRAAHLKRAGVGRNPQGEIIRYNRYQPEANVAYIARGLASLGERISDERLVQIRRQLVEFGEESFNVPTLGHVTHQKRLERPDDLHWNNSWWTWNRGVHVASLVNDEVITWRSLPEMHSSSGTIET